MSINKAIKKYNIKIIYGHKTLYFDKRAKEFVIHEKSICGEGWNRLKSMNKAINKLLNF